MERGAGAQQGPPPVSVGRRGALAFIIAAWLITNPARAVCQTGLPPTNDAAPTRALDDLMRVATRYQYDDVSGIDPWHDWSLSLAYRTPVGSVIAGVNTARRYEKNGAQLELQAYPFLTARSYLALNGAWSGSTGVFLPMRLSGEAFYNFPSGWETSVGARYFQTPGPDILFYTGTLGKYFGNHWVSGRPYFTGFARDDSYGWELTGRRYFADRFDYLSLLVSRSVGAAPEARDPQLFTQSERPTSFLARLDRRQRLGATHLRLTYGVGYERERIAPEVTRLHRTAALGLEWFIP